MPKISDFKSVSYDGSGNVDPQPGAYYVTVMDGPQVGFLLGPYQKHQDALDNVERARVYAEQVNVRAVFYAFGTARMEPGAKTRGLFNKDIGMWPEPKEVAA